MLLLATPWPLGMSPVGRVHSTLPSVKERALTRLRLTTSTLPAKTPAMYRSPSERAFFHTGVPSRRLMQWMDDASGAVKTTLPPAMAGGDGYQLKNPAGVLLVGCGGGNRRGLNCTMGWKGRTG